MLVRHLSYALKDQGESLGSFLPGVFGNVDGKWPAAW